MWGTYENSRSINNRALKKTPHSFEWQWPFSLGSQYPRILRARVRENSRRNIPVALHVPREFHKDDSYTLAEKEGSNWTIQSFDRYVHFATRSRFSFWKSHQRENGVKSAPAYLLLLDENSVSCFNSFLHFFFNEMHSLKTLTLFPL